CRSSLTGAVDTVDEANGPPGGGHQRTGAAYRPGRRVRWGQVGPVSIALAALCAGLAGIAVRIVILRHQVPLNSDESLAGLMARDLSHGHVQAFLWGQPYGGTLEVFPVAVMIAIFGSNLVGLRVTTLLLSAAAAWLAWRGAIRLTGRRSSIVAPAVLWLWPLYFVSWSSQEFLYYVPVVVLGLAIFLLSLQIRDDPNPW